MFNATGTISDSSIRLADGASALDCNRELEKPKPPDHPAICYSLITNVPFAFRLLLTRITSASRAVGHPIRQPARRSQGAISRKAGCDEETRNGISNDIAADAGGYSFARFS